MKKIISTTLALFVCASFSFAQFSLGGAINAAKNASNKAAAAKTTNSTTTSNANASASNSTATKSSGVVYYVSLNGTGRADGLSASTPQKEIQKVLNTIKDKNQNGATIRIAEGNYLGYMDQGYLEVSNWVTLEGGWNSDFTVRDPIKYQTKIEPTQEQLGHNTNKGVINFSGLDNTDYRVAGTVKIDGIMFNLGYENNYKPNDPSDPKNGCPSKAFETGRMIDDPANQPQHQIIHSDAAIAGNVIICNCLIANSPYFGIQFASRCGEVEIYNCVIISNRMGGVRIDGWDKEGYRSHVNFHHNTVCFSWCRDKLQEDMGYGYECMNKISCDIHHNIFACNNYAAIARTRALSGPDKVIEAKKVTNVYDNCFFMNAADLQLPSAGGGKWTNVACKNFEDVDEKILPKYEGNKELQKGDSFVNALDKDYLEGFATLKIVTSSSFDANSAANQYRQAHGLNMQGTETIRPSMYGNRYKYNEAIKLFGAKAGYGAQLAKY